MRGKLAVGAVALAMAVAGCGGGGDEEKDSSRMPTSP